MPTPKFASFGAYSERTLCTSFGSLARFNQLKIKMQSAPDEKPVEHGHPRGKS